MSNGFLRGIYRGGTRVMPVGVGVHSRTRAGIAVQVERLRVGKFGVGHRHDLIGLRIWSGKTSHTAVVVPRPEVVKSGFVPFLAAEPEVVGRSVRIEQRSPAVGVVVGLGFDATRGIRNDRSAANVVAVEVMERAVRVFAGEPATGKG